MNNLPPEALAYVAFHTEVLSWLSSAGRDSAFGWVALAAGACGIVFITRAWAIYSVIATGLLFYGLHGALEEFQHSLRS